MAGGAEILDAPSPAATKERSAARPPKDPRERARKYQLALCRRAVEENIIVCLGTGSGKTHIAAMLMYELRHLIRLPGKEVCIFLAPTIPLVQQQAMVIENSTDFKVQSYFGHGNNLKDHSAWSKEIEQSEVLVMTPQILLQNLRHCFIKMELIAILIFDECHHAQVQSRHPYAQIMKEFYKPSSTKMPRIFGMTASPSIGKGGSNQLNYSRCINSLENLLDSKVYSLDDNLKLESVGASPEIKVYSYGPVVYTDSSLIIAHRKKLEEIKLQCMSLAGEHISDLNDRQKIVKALDKIHANIIVCLESLGILGAIQAAQTLRVSEGCDMVEMENSNNSDTCIADRYLNKVASLLSCNISTDNIGFQFDSLEILEEPFFSKKFSTLIEILSTYRSKPDMKCIVFVKRIIVARTLAYILGKLKSLDFWKCEYLVGMHSGLRNMSRRKMHAIVEKFSSSETNLLVATNVAEEGLDIQTCCLVVRFDLPETVASFIQSRGRARMLKSEYVFLVERGNQHDEKLIKDFMSGENIMNNEILCRTSNDTFDDLEEIYYKVNSTGASISTGCSVPLLHHYCAKLPRDVYFTPSPKFFYVDDLDGTVCRVVLPPNAAIRQVESIPFPSKDEAKRAACLKACIQLHQQGALSDFLLPGLWDRKRGSATNHTECDSNEDEFVREELHQMLIPDALKISFSKILDDINLYFYSIKFVPIPEDRDYRMFGLFVKDRLPKEAETLEVDLHLAHGRIVKTGLLPVGKVMFDKEEITLARNFQEMFLKVILDRSEFFADFVPLGKNDSAQSSTFYLMLPLKKRSDMDSVVIDWTNVKRCLSSPVFEHPRTSYQESSPSNDTLKLFNGPTDKRDVLNSLVFTPHNKLFFFIDGIAHGTNADSIYKKATLTSYAAYYKERFGIQLSYPDKPFMKAKQLFLMHNLLHNRLQENTESREIEEHFVELPPELCALKIVDFSKDIGSSLSLLPSLMHRLESLLVAIELKVVLSASFQEAKEIRSECILEALTTEKCMERHSLERFEVLGDAFLKYVVGRHNLLTNEGLDEGQLTRKRSSLVNNSNLYELAIRNNLQMYIQDELFDPSQFFALGRPCRAVCNLDTESNIHYQQGKDATEAKIVPSNMKCSMSHRWLHRKTIADVVEALVGAFLVESGFKAAIAFLRWIGLQVDFDVQNVYRAHEQSKCNISLAECVDTDALEEIIGYKFKNQGLLLQAFVHPSYNKHSGGCYQKLEFLGDAVLEYLITSYLYSVYPELKPGQITDLRSLAVNNNSFARVAVLQSFHKFLLQDSRSLAEAIKKFENFVHFSDSEVHVLQEPGCPKVLGDIVESCIGAVLLDSGFNLKYVWHLMLTILEPVLGFSILQVNPVRELRELCQGLNIKLGLPNSEKVQGGYFVKVEVDAENKHYTFSATNHSSKAARRIAAQEALSKLKVLGFKHKNKSLEEIVHKTRKKEPKLIGFDEEPIFIDNIDDFMLEKLRIQRSEDCQPKLFLLDETEASPPFRNNTHQKQPPVASRSVRKPNVLTIEACNGSKKQPETIELHKIGIEAGTEYEHPARAPRAMIMNKVHDQNPPSCSYTTNGNQMEILGICKTARSQLFEACTANHWKPPSYECCKEEGPGHLRMFTYKVVIQIDGSTSSVLESFGEPKPQKKAAQEHAAEGAIWYLKHLGYIRQ